MSYEASRWLLAAHVYGFMMWTGTLFGAIHILQAHARAKDGAFTAFSGLERSLGISMDIGATIAIVFGVLALVLPEHGMALFKAGGFFHLKLTLVAGLIGIHVYLRRTIGQFKAGNRTPPPGFLFPLTAVVVIGIIVAIVVRPF